MGDVPAEAVSRLVPVLRRTLAAEVVIGPALPLPASSYDAGRRQYRSTALLDALARARRPGWDRLLGVADVDLFVPELNFVFGEADPDRGVAVFSLHRLRAEGAGPAGDELFARRAATEAVHELGHSRPVPATAAPLLDVQDLQLAGGSAIGRPEGREHALRLGRRAAAVPGLGERPHAGHRRARLRRVVLPEGRRGGGGESHAALSRRRGLRQPRHLRRP